MKKIGEGKIIRRSKTYSTEEVDLGDISDELYGDIMNVVMDEITIFFWRNKISLNMEWGDKHPHDFSAVDMANDYVFFHDSERKALINDLLKAIEIINTKKREEE